MGALLGYSVLTYFEHIYSRVQSFAIRLGLILASKSLRAGSFVKSGGRFVCPRGQTSLKRRSRPAILRSLGTKANSGKTGVFSVQIADPPTHVALEPLKI